MLSTRQRFVAAATTVVAPLVFVLSASVAQAASFEGKETKVVSGTSSSITINKPAGTQDGEVLLAQIVFDAFACDSGDNDDTSDDCIRIVAEENKGWKLVNITTDGEHISMATYYKTGKHLSSSYKWEFKEERCNRSFFGIRCEWRSSNVRSLGAVLRYSDVLVVGGSPIDSAAEADAPGSTVGSILHAPSVTPSNDDSTVVVFYGDNSNDSIVAAKNPLYDEMRTSGTDSHKFSIAGYDFVHDAVATDTIDGVTAKANHWVAQTVVLLSAEEQECTQECECVEDCCKEGGEGCDTPARGNDSRVRNTALVVSPNGGETYLHGSSADMFWTAEASPLMAVRVWLSTDSGATFPTLVTEQGWNIGYHNWTVPDINTTTARIRVQAIGLGDAVMAEDDSDADFAIVGTPVPPTPEVLGDADTVLPDGINAESFIKLASDGNPETQEDSTVYWIGTDKLAHAFVSQPAYMTWYTSFEDVQIVDEATLASLTQGETIGVRPGTSWIKTVEDDKVYYVAPGNVLRWIASEEAAVMLAGDDWQSNVLDMDASLLTGYTYGDDISVESLEAGWPDRALVVDAEAVWLVAGTERRRFVDDAFEANRYQERHVQADGSTGWTTLTLGADVTGIEAGLTDLLQ